MVALVMVFLRSAAAFYFIEFGRQLAGAELRSMIKTIRIWPAPDNRLVAIVARPGQNSIKMLGSPVFLDRIGSDATIRMALP
jgi:hypothetical protein